MRWQRSSWQQPTRTLSNPQGRNDGENEPAEEKESPATEPQGSPATAPQEVSPETQGEEEGRSETEHPAPEPEPEPEPALSRSERAAASEGRRAALRTVRAQATTAAKAISQVSPEDGGGSGPDPQGPPEGD